MSFKEGLKKQMDDELKNLVKVWILAITSLSYCYYITSRIPKGFLRLLSLIPVFYLFIILPLSLSSFHLTGVTSFFLVWLANFKLLLFAFDQGPLSLTNKLTHFALAACLPIKIKQHPPAKSPSKPPPNLAKPLNTKNNTNRTHQITDQTQKSNDSKSILLVIKVVLLLIILKLYDYKQYLHHRLVLALYCFHLYLQLEIVLALCAIPARVFGFELEPQFNEPYLATSLQDFWGSRWNLMVTSILRPTVYIPVQRISSRIIGQKWTQLPGVIATFAVSGLMHEVIYYYLARVPPTWEVTCFFVLQGVCVAVEVWLKKKMPDRWKLPPVLSGPFALVFVAVTGVWLFFPQLLRSNLDEKALSECSIFIDFVKQVVPL